MDDYPLLQALIKTHSPDKDDKLEKFFKRTLEVTSVFDILRFTKATLQAKLQSAPHPIDVDKLYDGAQCFAAQISHLYREQQLSSGKEQHHWHPPGIRAVEKEGPTYANLFQENWDEFCKTDSIAAIDSPVAYLRALYLFAGQLESSLSTSNAETAHRILLKKRRPDLAKLSIDQHTTFTPQPMLGIVNDILNNNIQEALKSTSDRGKSTHEVLANRRFPFALPYEIFHHQCLLGLSGEKPGLGELNYLISAHLPLTQTASNLYGQVLVAAPGEAQQLMSGLGPRQQALLTEHTRAEIRRDAAYWKNTYGTTDHASLSSVSTFLQRTELTAEQLEALLSQGKHTPRRSSNHTMAIYRAAPYGARYVNGPTSIDDTRATSMALPLNGEIKKIAHMTEQRLERLHRMIRLQRWLDIPFAELDTLIISAFESQVPRNTGMRIEAGTVRALGVYRYLNRRYSISGEEFAALLHQVSPYVIGGDYSLLDRVFNPAQLFETPLVLDGRPFSSDDAEPVSHTILQHLSACLGLPMTEDSLLLIVKNTQQYAGPLKCDTATLSAIYRQARIARMLGISIADMTTLATLLGGESIARCLVGLKSEIRTFRLVARRKQDSTESVEVVARFRLPPTIDSDIPPQLLQGSTLKITTSWFAAKDSINELRIHFPMPASSNANANISISVIPPAITHTALEGLPISIENGEFDALLERDNAFVTLTTTRSDNTSSDITYFDVSLTPIADVPNLPDVLMQMDWLTRWIDESVYDIPKLRHLLDHTGSEDHPQGDLQRHLSKLSADSLQCAVTPREIAELSLPNTVAWRSLLAKELLDAKGLVKHFAPGIENDAPDKLTAALDKVIDTLSLAPDASKDLRLKVDCKKKLKDMLQLAHDRQLHLVEKLLQETSLLPMNCTKGVLLWANVSVYEILSSALDGADSTRLFRTLQPVLRHAEAAVQLQLSNSALQMFLSHPEWLQEPGTRLTLTLSSLYLLDRFNHCMTLSQLSEENLLGYLQVANSNATTAAKNSLLAKLMKWTATEVSVLTTKLAYQQARTMKDVDWVMRCHTACQASGLSAASLLAATALNNTSSPADWKKVGEAVMATRH
ncbi:Tc toxin subunit A [Pseudomonas sp. dw_612]|uniref:Tc toxin subunit A n=1 Tax=Pseudomonas sp. dw_612 TaxID=2720080 RepID=UPI001BD2ED7E|nr:Tc toxin subunit A [Pseudomonas sp. dw_612]